MSDIKTGSIEITGLADLEKRLLQFSDRVAKNIMGGALRAGAVVVQKEARLRAPVGSEAHWLGTKSAKSRVLIQPGTLKKGIRVRKAPSKYTGDRNGLTYWVYVQRNLWYWKFKEFGTSKMSASPFMRPAFEAMKELATEAIRDYLGQRIDKEAAKL